MNLRTVRDAAQMLGVNEMRVRRAARDGRIPAMQLGNRMLVDVDAACDVLSRPDGVTIDVVSAETGLTESAIRRAIREGWMPYEKPGKAYLFDMGRTVVQMDKRIVGESVEPSVSRATQRRANRSVAGRSARMVLA